MITQIVAIIFNLLLDTLGKIPLSFRRSIGRLIGRVFALLPMRDKKTARLHLEKILKVQDTEKILCGVFQNLALNICEMINSKPIFDNPDHFIHVDTPEETLRILNSKKPYIALSAHFGNWDLLAGYITSHGHRLITAARQARNPILQIIIAELRRRLGIEIIWRKSISDSRRLIKLMKEPVLIGALIDQDTRVNSITSEFFGHTCKTPSGLIELGLENGSNFCSCFIARENDKFCVYMKEIKAQSEKEIISEFNSRLEALIRRYPEQWVWFHKRWRTNNNNKAMSTAEYWKYLESLP